MALLYVDESGEEGFSTTSSEWFILGGALHKGSDVQEIKEMYQSFKDRTNRQPNWHFHFARKTHEERLCFARAIAQAPYHGMAVAFHKRSITKKENFSKKYFMYFYAFRLLLERASRWSKSVAQEPLWVILSDRGGLRQENIVSYLSTIQCSIFTRYDRIAWDHVNYKEIEIKQNKDYIGLQAADCIASSLARSLEPHKEFKITDDCYVDELTNIFEKSRYTRRECIKIWPTTTQLYTDPRLDWLYGRGGWRRGGTGS